MHYKKAERLKELAFALSRLSADMLAVFLEEDRESQANEEALKKIRKAG